MQPSEASEVRGGLLRGEQLNTTGRVLEYPEGQASLEAPQHQPTGHCYVNPTFLSSDQGSVVVQNPGRVDARFEPVGDPFAHPSALPIPEVDQS